MQSGGKLSALDFSNLQQIAEFGIPQDSVSNLESIQQSAQSLLQTYNENQNGTTQIKALASAFDNIDGTNLSQVVTALAEMATHAQTLAGIPWDTIVAGIRAITNAQNGGNGGDGDEGGGNPHDRDTGITGHDRPTQYGNTNQPIKLEGVKADKVDATGSTIDASGASINTGNTGGEKGEENNNSNISSITTSGAINVTGSPVNIAGASNGGNNNDQNETSPSLNPSGVTDAIKTMQSAIDGISATKAEEAASAFNKAMSKTMSSVPDSKTVKINIDKPESVDVTAEVKVKVTVSGDGVSQDGDHLVTGRGAPGTPAKIIRASASSKGNVALAKGRETLMGELGPELVVQQGRYFVAGQ